MRATAKASRLHSSRTPATVRARLEELHLEIPSAAGRRVARHQRAPASAGHFLQSPEHARPLEIAALDAFTTAKPCPRAQNRPPGRPTQTAASALLGEPASGGVVIDLHRSAQLAGQLPDAPPPCAPRPSPLLLLRSRTMSAADEHSIAQVEGIGLQESTVTFAPSAAVEILSQPFEADPRLM